MNSRTSELMLPWTEISVL